MNAIVQARQRAQLKQHHTRNPVPSLISTWRALLAGSSPQVLRRSGSGGAPEGLCCWRCCCVLLGLLQQRARLHVPLAAGWLLCWPGTGGTACCWAWEAGLTGRAHARLLHGRRLLEVLLLRVLLLLRRHHVLWLLLLQRLLLLLHVRHHVGLRQTRWPRRATCTHMHAQIHGGCSSHREQAPSLMVHAPCCSTQRAQGTSTPTVDAQIITTHRAPPASLLLITRQTCC